MTGSGGIGGGGIEGRATSTSRGDPTRGGAGERTA